MTFKGGNAYIQCAGSSAVVQRSPATRTELGFDFLLVPHLSIHTAPHGSRQITQGGCC